MQTFIIYLKELPHSKAMAQIALASAQKHGWQAQLFAGYFRNKGVKYMQEEGYCPITMASPYHSAIIQTQYIKNRDISPGAVGCAASHIALWKRCVDLNENIAVLEHDAEVIAACPDCAFEDYLVFGPEIEHIQKRGVFKQAINLSNTTTAQPLFWNFKESAREPQITAAPSTMGYIISPKGAAQLLADIKHWGYSPMDRQIRHPVVSLQIKMPLVMRMQENSRECSITNDRDNLFVWFEYLPLLSYLNITAETLYPILAKITKKITRKITRKEKRLKKRIIRWKQRLKKYL